MAQLIKTEANPAKPVHRFLRAFRNLTKVRLLLLTIGAVILGAILPGGSKVLCHVLAWFFAAWLVLAILAALLRFLFSRVLWTVRSRLIVTCLLLGLAPIILFGSLAAIAAYVFSGQFATSVAAEAIKDASAQVQQQGAAWADRNVPLSQPSRRSQGTDPALLITTWRDGKALLPTASATPFALASPPPWLQADFKGVIYSGAKLFVCGSSSNLSEGHQTVVLACSPLRDGEVQAMAESLGTIGITRGLSGDEGSKDTYVNASGDIPRKFTLVQGGRLPAAKNFFDVPVYFSAPLVTRSWPGGDDLETWLFVISRPAVLYKALFASSLQTGLIVKGALISTAVVFVVLELLACLMAILLIRTITGSIADMYQATRQIDKGNLQHRIRVKRKDQLAALATSFNTMTGSLDRVMHEQIAAEREKDRIQNELKIAQEVQNNLFPHTAINLPNFEIYGTCLPARTVGGDYYDFIPYGNSQLYLALGDISGKGISAALLMASLHSAVRAYRSGTGPKPEDLGLGPEPELNVSPGRLMALLNQHLLSSTQAAKYATLFLASYDSETRKLTYSNGGHLPPLMLCANGETKKLDCGGSVVGLMDGLKYDEETVQMNHGDLLVLFSDGLTEPERETEDFGEDRLEQLVRRNLILPLPDIAARSFAAVKEWIGDAEQPDDMTMVLARLS